MGDSFTIQISSNLVNRLSHDEEILKKKTKKPKAKTPKAPKTPKSPQHSQTKVVPQKPASDGLETQKGPAAAANWAFQPPLFMPVTTPPSPQVESRELDAIRCVLKESEKVVESLQKREEALAQEVTQKAKELRDKEFKLPYQKPMPCLAEQDACKECYKEFAKDPLKCAGLVNKFADCARKMRQQVGLAHLKIETDGKL